VITDNYSTDIEVYSNGTYKRQGVTIVAESDEKALSTFNAMLPDGYVSPVQEEVKPSNDEILEKIKALMAQLG